MSKYERGYLPKIEYWMGLMNKAVEKGDVRMIELSAVKLKYFTQRQTEVYGGGMHTLQEVGEFSPLLKEFFKNNYK